MERKTQVFKPAPGAIERVPSQIRWVVGKNRRDVRTIAACEVFVREDVPRQCFGRTKPMVRRERVVVSDPIRKMAVNKFCVPVFDQCVGEYFDFGVNRYWHHPAIPGHRYGDEFLGLFYERSRDFIRVQPNQVFDPGTEVQHTLGISDLSGYAIGSDVRMRYDLLNYGCGANVVAKARVVERPEAGMLPGVDATSQRLTPSDRITEHAGGSAECNRVDHTVSIGRSGGNIGAVGNKVPEEIRVTKLRRLVKHCVPVLVDRIDRQTVSEETANLLEVSAFGALDKRWC